MTYDFHFVMSTVGRAEEMARFLESLKEQNASVFITLVEQSPEAGCESLLKPLVDAGHAEYVHEPVVRGLSRGRNVGLENVRGDVVAFPDDDCWYPAGLLEKVLERIQANKVDGISVKLTSEDGQGNLLRWLEDEQDITHQLLPRTVTSATLFLSRELANTVGGFDEELGAGSGTQYIAGEEADYVFRALSADFRLRFIPDLHVYHPEWREGEDLAAVREKVRGYNRGFAHVLRKHSRRGEFLYWIARSVAGASWYGLRLNRRGFQQQIDQLAGRLQGWFR
jgi:GT2 family glycosyltransferase